MKQKNRTIVFLALGLFWADYSQASSLNPVSEHLLFGAPTCSGQILERAGYVLCYDKVTKNATWASYHLVDDYLPKKGVKRTDDFRSDPALQKGERQELSDYKGTKFDRGHLVPANDMDRSLKTMSESFLLSNMTPQYYGFNRGIWKELEAKVRKWAMKKRNIYIFTGPLYLDKQGRRASIFKPFGKNKIAMPTHHYKIIIAMNDNNLDTIAFIIPNKAYPTSKMPSFISSIDEIEKDSGIDFLPDLDDSKESKLESIRASSLW